MPERAAHESDVELTRSVLAGSREAADRFVERMACIPAILKARSRRLPFPFSPEELRDLAQEVFTKMWERLDSFSGQGCLEAWAYRFCHNVMMNAYQARWRRVRLGDELPEETGDPAAEGVPFGDRLALVEALATLPRDEAEVIELKHHEGLSFTEIGERLQIPANSAKTRYYRGLRTLEQRLGREFRREGT